MLHYFFREEALKSLMALLQHSCFVFLFVFFQFVVNQFVFWSKFLMARGPASWLGTQHKRQSQFWIALCELFQPPECHGLPLLEFWEWISVPEKQRQALYTHPSREDGDGRVTFVSWCDLLVFPMEDLLVKRLYRGRCFIWENERKVGGVLFLHWKRLCNHDTYLIYHPHREVLDQFRFFFLKEIE